MKTHVSAWRRHVGLAVALALVALARSSPASADLGGFTIADFHSDLTVEPNADLTVEERIAVDFQEDRHGLYRTIPVRYTDPHGYGYSVDFRLLGAEDGDGRRVGTQVTQEGQYVRIRLGDAERYVRGRQVYVIRYRVQGAVKQFSDHDEIYWNAVGDEWQTTIAKASAAVHVPADVPADRIDVVAYTGRFGSTAGEVEAAVSDAGVATYDATRALEPREMLTIVAAWPSGHVDFPGPLHRFLGLLLDNWILAAPLAALGFMVDRYRKVGRDPQGAPSVMVEYEPPEGMTAGEIGALVDEKVDLPDITATVVDLAIRGHLKIGEDERKGLFTSSSVPSFERTAASARLLPHEQEVVDGLFASGDHVTTTDLKEAFYTRLPAIRKAIYTRLTEGGYFAADPDAVRTRWVGLAVLAGAVTVAIGGGWSYLRGGIMPLALIVPVIAGVLVALVTGAFAFAMPRRTDAGVRMRAWALGFQEFVRRVEADRIARENRIGVFESLLPYAMALGVAAIWAKKFEGIYESAPPAWYVGPLPHGGLSTSHMEHSLSSAMATTAAVMATTPRASGSSGMGGGGFSGGGFGGGGGGSW